MLDKVFFLDKVDTEAFMDFGCGDGALLDFIQHHVDPSVKLYGFDNDAEMIRKAQEKTSRITFFKDWKDVEDWMDNSEFAAGTMLPYTLILSSVIHEIYHYSTPEQIDEFWKKVFCGKFAYITIRDMVPSRTIARPSDINDVAKVYKKFLHHQELEDFENTWGSIENNKNLVHFLLKYRYVKPNWKREVKENYLPLYREDLLSLLDTNDYEIIYHEHYILPHIKQLVQSDFGIELKDATHLKMILRNKKMVVYRG